MQKCQSFNELEMHGVLESDHSMLCVEILVDNADGSEVKVNCGEVLDVVSPVRWKRPVHREDWIAFHDACENSLGQWLDELKERKDPVKIENLWDSWWSTIRTLANENLGIRSATHKSKRKELYEGQLRVLVEERNSARRRRNQTVGHERGIAQEAYCKARKTVKKFINEIAHRKVQNMNDDLSNWSKSDTKKYWKKLKDLVGKSKDKKNIPTEAICSGKTVTGDLRKQAWKESFEKMGQHNDGSEFRAHGGSFYQDLKSIDELEKDIDIAEVEAIWKYLRMGKAAGVDGVFNEVLKEGGDMIRHSVWALCAQAFREERIPQEWAKGLITPIFKEGDPTDPNNYRGITLLSVVGKVFTAVLNHRLTHWCEKNGKFTEEQAGFRSGRSTTDQVFILPEIIHSRKEKEKILLLFFGYQKSVQCLEKQYGIGDVLLVCPQN